MSDIYLQHDAAFKRVQAFVVMKEAARVATVAFRLPEDGAGRLYAYTHWLGIAMVRGHANGYGYDKRSAAVEDAVAKLETTTPEGNGEDFRKFVSVLKDCGGDTWNGALHKAGFTVLQAV